ncbi:MAG: hypothetical protein MJ231_09105, partial [bacterium]|nr:hypothetical protein [bacterium]
KCQEKWEKKEHPVSGSLVPLVNCLPKCGASSLGNNLLIEKTNECVADCASITPGKYYEFNKVCYIDICPINTKEDGNSQKCVCDPTYGYWHKNNDESLECGLEKLENCPSDKQLYNYDTKECVTKCIDPYLYKLGKTCRSACPTGFKANEATNECETDSFTKANNLNELKELVDKDYINLIKEAEGGKIISFENEGSLHAYKLNKDIPGLEYNALEENLTLINIDKCIKNVYDANGLSDSAYIYVIKYDVLNSTKDYLYNTAEYDFYSKEETPGDPVIKKLDISICTGYSVSVSYPIINYIKDENCPFSESVKNEFMKRFEIAKKVHAENPNVDLFNYNDPVYYDICTPFSIDNKDVILRDRRNFLYPGIHLCENNCTPAYTDYARERFVCDCLLKSNIFLDRNGYPSETSNFGNFSYNNTKVAQRGPTNFPVLSCIDNFKHDKKHVVTKNAGFYYAVIVGGAIVLCGIVSIFSYFVLSKKIKKKEGGDAAQKAAKEKALTASQKRLNTSTERNEAAPPPRKGEVDFDEKNRRIKNIDYGEKIDVMDYSGDIEPEEEPTCL